MKVKGIICPLVILLAACQEKPTTADAKAPEEKTQKQSTHMSSSTEAKSDSAAKDGKSTVRTERPKKPPVAMAVAGQRGKVLSPHSEELVDVTGLAAGSVVQDPKFPGDESKKFTVPEGVETFERPEAKAVPGRPGYVFSPYSNQMIDVSGFRAGALARDPSYPGSENKIFRIPAAAVAAAEENAGPDAEGGEAEAGALIGAGAGAIIGNSEEPTPEEE